MARITPEELEQRLHAVLRSQPPRRAPHTLEARVLGEIARRQALPWWRKSIAYWPVPMRLAFVALGVAAAILCGLGAFVGVGEMGPLVMAQVVEPLRAFAANAREVGTTLAELTSRVIPTVNSTWLYAGLAVVGAAYATLVGLGATAYRLLWQSR